MADADGTEFHLLSVPDLVQAKKTQRTKDWPIIELLVAIHYRENAETARPDHILFWLLEARTPELLVELVDRFPAETEKLSGRRSLLQFAQTGDLVWLRTALDAEVREVQAADRAYWAPLKAELEAFRREAAEGRSPAQDGDR